MGAAEVTSITKRMVAPIANQKVWMYKYTKTAADDYIECASEFAALEGGSAQQIAGSGGGTAGADDPATVSSLHLVLSAGTGTGVAIVFGTG